MKKALKIIRNIIIVLYAIIAIFVTICLLSYNKYKVSEFGSYSLVIIDNNELSPDFEKGDLVIVDGNEKIEIGDKIFFYNTFEKDVPVTLAQVIEKEKITDTETTYILEGDKALSGEYVIGTSSEVTKIGTVGTILGILESKWGFILLVVLPALLALLYEVFEVIQEVKNSSNNKDKKGNEDKQD